MNAPFSPATRPHGPGQPESGKYKLTMQDYLLLDDAGAFRGEQTELIDGDVIVMSPEWIPHMRAKDEIAYNLRRAIETAALNLIVGTGGSVALSHNDVPRPDIMVLRDLSGVKAIAREALLIAVEVSSTTLFFDIGEKAMTYARYGVPEYWIADVNGRVIHQMWSPTEDGYASRKKIIFGQPISSATVEDLRIETGDL